MATILAGVMALGMTACGSKPTETTATPTEPSTVESTTEATTSETIEETTKANAFTPEQALGLIPNTGITVINIGNIRLAFRMILAKIN